MGRSVSTPSAATLVAHGTIDEDDDLTLFTDAYADQLRVMYPSVVAVDKWLDREDHVVAENQLATFGMSHYWGVIAYWVIPKQPLGQAWIDCAADGFMKAFGQLESLGTASNGETFYRRIK